MFLLEQFLHLVVIFVILVHYQFTPIFLVNPRPAHAIIKQLPFLLCNFLDFNNLTLIYILGHPGAVTRGDNMSVVKVYCKIETSLWALALTEPVPEVFELAASDWPEKIQQGGVAG